MEVRLYESSRYMGTSNHYDLASARIHCQDVIIGLGPDRADYRHGIVDKQTRKVVEVIK